MNRRRFLIEGIAAGAVIASGVVSAQPSPSAVSGQPGAPAEPRRQPPLAPERVKEFVGAGHGNLPRVRQLLTEEPHLINATWDWGAGDWETGLGGAAHVGNRDMVLHLVEAGARIDAFSLATLGEAESVKALVRSHPATARNRGPHGFTLLYHVGYTGSVDLAEAVGGQLAGPDRARHFNQALQTAVARGHSDLVAYLLEAGVDDPNLRNFQGKTPLDIATARKETRIIQLLRAKGALTTL